MIRCTSWPKKCDAEITELAWLSSKYSWQLRHRDMMQHCHSHMGNVMKNRALGVEMSSSKLCWFQVFALPLSPWTYRDNSDNDNSNIIVNSIYQSNLSSISTFFLMFPEHLALTASIFDATCCRGKPLSMAKFFISVLHPPPLPCRPLESAICRSI